MSYQLEFEFVGDHDISKRIRLIRSEHEILEHELLSDDNNLPEYYRVNKFADWLFDKLPFVLGWKWYHQYSETKLWCFSTYQKLRYGVSDLECWNLSNTIAEFTLPRLKHFKKMKRWGVPPQITESQWESIIDETIWAFEYILDDEKFNPAPSHSFVGHGDFESTFNRKKTPDEDAAWKAYFEKSRELHDRKQKALVDYAKYFEHFWD
jgi:hypothetical protein